MAKGGYPNAPIEVTALNICKFQIERSLLEGMLTPESPFYPRVLMWMRIPKEMGLEADLRNRYFDDGDKYVPVIQDSLSTFTDLIKDLREVDLDDSCQLPLAEWCPVHEENHDVTVEEVFAGTLAGLLGFLRCVLKGDPNPIIEVPGEEAGHQLYDFVLSAPSLREKFRPKHGTPEG